MLLLLTYRDCSNTAEVHLSKGADSFVNPGMGIGLFNGKTEQSKPAKDEIRQSGIPMRWKG